MARTDDGLALQKQTNKLAWMFLILRLGRIFVQIMKYAYCVEMKD